MGAPQPEEKAFQGSFRPDTSVSRQGVQLLQVDIPPPGTGIIIGAIPLLVYTSYISTISNTFNFPGEWVDPLAPASYVGIPTECDFVTLTFFFPLVFFSF